MNTMTQRLTGPQLVRSMLLFLGAFLFAFAVNSYIIHEAGHAFGGVLFGCQFEGLHLNPFSAGGWRNQCPDAMTPVGEFIQGMGGEIFGLPISILVPLLLWRKRSPLLLPLLMAAEVVCIGNVISVLDSLSSFPHMVFDYGLMLKAGVPSFVLSVIAIVSLVLGIIFMVLLFPLAGIGKNTPFWQVLVLSLMTWPFFLALRMIYQSAYGKSISGPFSLLIFGLIVVILTALPFTPITKLLAPITRTEPVLPSMGAVWLSVGLGVGLTVLLMA